jgi:hypothetical protein
MNASLQIASRDLHIRAAIAALFSNGAKSIFSVTDVIVHNVL